MRWLGASLTQWTWVWASSWRWWRTGKPDVLQSLGLQRVRHNLATEQQQWYRDKILPWDLGSILRPEKPKTSRSVMVGEISSLGQEASFLMHFKYPRSFLRLVSSYKLKEAVRSLWHTKWTQQVELESQRHRKARELVLGSQEDEVGWSSLAKVVYQNPWTTCSLKKRL